MNPGQYFQMFNKALPLGLSTFGFEVRSPEIPTATVRLKIYCIFAPNLPEERALLCLTSISKSKESQNQNLNGNIVYHFFSFVLIELQEAAAFQEYGVVKEGIECSGEGWIKGLSSQGMLFNNKLY